MTGDNLIGNCIASTLDIKIRNPNTIPRMAQVDIEVRLDDGETQSEWLPKGTYFIDTRAIEDDVLHIVAYDAMLKTEQSFTQAGEQGDWPRTDITVVNQIAQRIGVSVDARTTALMSRGYLVQYPGIVLEDGTPKYSADGGLTMREVLGYIGVMYGGNWFISDAGALRLVPLTGSGDATVLGNDVGELETSPAFDAISRVTLIVGTDEDGDEVSYTAGADTGRELTAKCPWATQTIANNLLTALGGYVYQPFTAGDALLDPAAELGDAVSVGDITSQLGSIATTFDALYTADIEAPESEEINHEYPYQDKGTRNIERKIAQSKSEIMVKMDSIVLRVTDDSGVTSEVKLTEAGKIDLTGYATFRGLLEGTTVIDGGCIKADTKIESPVIVGGTIYAGTPENMLGYLKMVNDGLEVYNKDGLLKFRIGYTSSDFDYPYIQLGSGNGGGANSRGIVKKFVDGLWIGNGIAIDATGNFSPQAGYNGIFVKFTDGKTYVVNGSNMMNVYTGDVIARFG